MKSSFENQYQYRLLIFVLNAYFNFSLINFSSLSNIAVLHPESSTHRLSHNGTRQLMQRPDTGLQSLQPGQEAEPINFASTRFRWQSHHGRPQDRQQLSNSRPAAAELARLTAKCVS